MQNKFRGEGYSVWAAFAVIMVALFLFRHSQECSISVASVLLMLPF